MAENWYEPAEYALQRIVQRFGDLLFTLAECNLSHIYAVGFRYCQLESIDYLVLRYLNTGALPYEEFSEEWLYDEEIWFTFTSQTVVGKVSIQSGEKKQHWILSCKKRLLLRYKQEVESFD